MMMGSRDVMKFSQWTSLVAEEVYACSNGVGRYQ